MTRYIEAEKLENIISDGLNSGKFGHDAVEILSEIYALESADVAPVVHGKWESVYTTYWKWKPDGAHPVDRIIYRCSECNRRTAIKTSYCPNCGAKMDLWRFEE